MKQTGQCLCGAVRFSFRQPTKNLQVCHCGQCRRWTGGGPLFGVRVEDVEILGEDQIGRFQASEHGERCFCKICGTTLFWRMQGKSVAYLCPGVLDDDGGMTVTEEIFVDCRASWMPPWEGASQSTEANEIAKLEAFLADQGRNQ
ncbi:MAG: GFA family protein [Pseudomonadota bacterium]